MRRCRVRVLRLRSCSPLSSTGKKLSIFFCERMRILTAPTATEERLVMRPPCVGHADVLAVLLAAGPNLDLFDNGRRTPLRNAISLNHERCALMLIEAGARLDDRWLCDAAALGTDMLQVLVDRGVVVSELRGLHACTLCCTLSLSASRIGLRCCRCWCATAVLMWTRVTPKEIHHATLLPAIGLSISCDGSSMRAQILMFRTVEVKRHCIWRARMKIWNVSFYSSQLVQTCTCETQMAGLRFTGLLKGGVIATRLWQF
jgi:hypothetical protein